jgi:hypothetical protein
MMEKTNAPCDRYCDKFLPAFALSTYVPVIVQRDTIQEGKLDQIDGREIRMK